MIIALVGLCGSGKSEAAKFFLERNFEKVYFGGITMEELKKRGLSINEKNERMVREELRKKYGMSAYAILSLPKINDLVNQNKNVLIDGLYSWSEYKILKEKYPLMKVIALYTDPELRYQRLSTRKERALSREEAISRDISEIENLEKAGPIAMADYLVLNNNTIQDLYNELERILNE